MKNRIIAVVLSVLVGIGFFASSVRFKASGDEIAPTSVFDYIGDWFSFVYDHSLYKLLFHDEQVLPTVSVYEVLTTLRDFCESKNMSSSEITSFVNQLYNDYPSYSTISISDKVFMVACTSALMSNDWDAAAVINWLLSHLKDSGYGFNSNGHFYMPSDKTKELLEEQNKTITPKNRQMYKYSWRELSDDQRSYSATYLARMLGKNGEFVDGASFADGVYIQPYFSLGDCYYGGRNYTGHYYSPYQYHIFCDVTAGDNLSGSDGGYYPNYTYTWKYEALHYLVENGERLDTKSGTIYSYSDKMSNGVYTSAYCPFVSFGYDFNGNLGLSFYGNQLNCLTEPTKTSYYTLFFPQIGNSQTIFLKSNNVDQSFHILDFFQFIAYGNLNDYFTLTPTSLYSSFHSMLPNDNITDYGFLVSATPFETTYFFDISRIPDNSTTTVNGDTVYDYSITDNSTGDTTTIYNYVTNNYEYPEKEDSGNGSGGSFGGDINVGGKVEVGGSVDVNVSVDVNLGNTVGGGGVVGEMPDMSPVDGYLQDALQESSGIRGFLKEFFDFLPAEILMLLGILLSVVILARLLGR